MPAWTVKLLALHNPYTWTQSFGYKVFVDTLSKPHPKKKKKKKKTKKKRQKRQTANNSLTSHIKIQWLSFKGVLPLTKVTTILAKMHIDSDNKQSTK